MRVTILFFLAMTLPAQAQNAAPPASASATGNLPAGFYPKSPCVKGNADFGRQPDQRDGRAVEAYNEKIRAYNKAMEAFNTCIVDYAARANHDIQEIRAAVTAANAN